MKLDKIYNANNSMRFHMPGHSGSDIFIGSRDDITELSYSDNLMNPHGELLDLERFAAKTYGAKYSLLFTCGATSAVNASLYALKNILPGARLYIGGGAHKSVFSYAHIHDIEISDRSDNADASIVTAPNYYGQFRPEQTPCRFKILDASHAAHYPFCEKFPSIPGGYDIVIYSLHKTLPVLTGGAAVVTDDYDTYLHLLYARALTHTSSPSYMTLISIDKAFDRLTNQGNYEYSRVYHSVSEFIKASPLKAYYYDDFTRLILDTGDKDAFTLSRYLEDNGIFAELTEQTRIVFIVTPYNCVYLNNLLKLLRKAPLLPSAKPYELPQIQHGNPPKIVTISFAEPRDAIGSVSAAEIGAYPPGTPVVNRYDIITTETVEFIEREKARIFGMYDGKIAIYNERKIPERK